MIPVGILTAAATTNFVGLLDQYPGAAAAFSFRKLRNAYTGPCIRVSSTGVGVPQLDIGFVNNVLDTTTLLTFIGANSGYIITWYDQSGNGNNATQTNGALIVSSGVLITDSGKVAATNIGIFTLNTAIVPNSSYAAFSVMSRITSNGFMTSFSGLTLPIISLAYNNSILYNYNLVTEISYNFTSTGRFLFTTINQSTVQSAYLNGTIKTVTTNPYAGTGNIVRIFGRSPVEGFEFTGKTQEQIFYNISQSSNVTGINNNINTFYNIFTPTWSGNGTALLDLYPSAAAAYSLRNLSSTYLGPLVRVRRSSDNTEQDFYGLYNGQIQQRC